VCDVGRCFVTVVLLVDARDAVVEAVKCEELAVALLEAAFVGGFMDG
jgi:hypothetical protein